MSFKDKLKTIKKSKKPTKKIPKISTSDPNTSSADFDSFNEFSDLNQLPSSESNISESITPESSFEDFAAQADDSKSTSANKLSKRKPTRKSNKKKINKPSKLKAERSSRKNKVNKPKSDSNDLTKKILLLVSLLLLLLALGAAFFFKDSLFGSNDVAQTPVTPKTQPSTPKPITKKPDAPVTPPDIDTSHDIDEKNQIDDAVNLLEEEIKAELPNTDVEAAEELDLLNDESQRLQKQEKDLDQLITAKEDLVKLKEQKIALLEKQIAEAEAAAATVQ